MNTNSILKTTLLSALASSNVSDNQSIYSFTLNDIDGNPVSLEKYRGKVALLVNVASKCGYTYQYEGLQALYEKYSEKGLVVLGFPANDFLGQEPGSEAEIKAFCSTKYGVTFPMFSKISVKGRTMHPLYTYLTSKESNPKFAGKITWNFNKFLIGPEGEILARFDKGDKPEDPKVIETIEAALEKLGNT